MDQIGKALVSSTTSSTPQRVAEPIRSAADLPSGSSRAIDRDLPDRLIAFWRTSGPDGPASPTLRRAMTQQERALIEVRLGDLRRALAPLESTVRDAGLRDRVGRMLSGFPQLQRADSRAALGLAVTYLENVRDLPPWAIARACEKVGKARVASSVDWPPSEARFRLVVEELIEQFNKAARDLAILLEAPVEEEPPKPTREELEAKLGRPLTPARSTPALREHKPATAYTPEEIAAANADLAERKRKAIAELEAAEKIGGGNDGDQKAGA